MYQRRRRGPGIGLLFLLSQLYNIGFNRIPPVTLSFIGINVAVYLGLLNDLPSLGKACVSAQHVWVNGEWKRLLFAAFYHLDDFHLYYNMASFVWKGISLEGRMGSSKFLYILAVFTVLTNVVLVGLDLALANITGNFSYIRTCAAGFSGVIFALKVLTTYNLPSGVSTVMGMFPVPMRWACWTELVLIQLLFPNASFTGHLAGILVGLMYVKGPLKYIMDTVSGAGSGVTWRMRQSYTYHARTTGRRRYSTHSSDSEDEDLRQAIRASLRETHMNRPPSLDDYDPGIQSAIRESLDDAGGEPSRWSNNPGPQRRGPSSRSPPYPTGGYNSPGIGSSSHTPVYPTHQDSLYPRIPRNPPSYIDGQFSYPQPYPLQGEGLYPRVQPEPSAPPVEQGMNGYPGGTLPYPSGSRMPELDSVDEIRRRRIQRFEN